MEDNREREHKYIRERIVPRKKYRKILGIAGAVIGAAVLFGASAGAVFYLMQTALKRDEVQESQIETIIIARDDVTVSPESTSGGTEGSTGKSTAARSEDPKNSTESAPPKKTSEDPSETPGSEDPTEPSGSDPSESTDSGERTASPEESGSESDESGKGSGESTPETADTESETETETTEESISAETEREPGPAEESSEEVSPGLKDRALEIAKGIVQITVREISATDWFSAAILQKRELFGAVIAENSEYLLILTRAEGLEQPGTEITVTVDGVTVPCEFQRADAISGLAVLRAEKAVLEDRYEVLPLGNSLTVQSADPVWFAGLVSGSDTGVNEGIITYVENYHPTIDGYVQRISTSMLHYPREQGILLNAENEIIGIVADASCTEGVVMSAWGISPIKYLLEDMCSGAGTAYIGIRCVDVSGEEADVLGIPSGLYIQEIIPDSPAYNAGLLPGDRVVRVGAGTVNTNHLLQLWMDNLEAGSEITVGIERRGPGGYEPLELQLILGERK